MIRKYEICEISVYEICEISVCDLNLDIIVRK